jgi:hypothetical protein
MLRILSLILLGIITLTLLACDQPGTSATSEKPKNPSIEQQAEIITESKNDSKSPAAPTPTSRPASESKPALEFNTVEWTDLMPDEDLDALLNPPSYVTDIKNGSLEDQITSQIQNSVALASDDRYQQALASTRVIPEMDGKAIRIPGFIVPLEFDDEQIITQFFLVPFFGACIHVPPPPPNQIIFVNYPQGLKLDALYDPFWISGVLKTSLVENDMAIAAYSMQMQSFEVYTE